MSKNNPRMGEQKNKKKVTVLQDHKTKKQKQTNK